MNNKALTTRLLQAAVVQVNGLASNKRGVVEAFKQSSAKAKGQDRSVMQQFALLAENDLLALHDLSLALRIITEVSRHDDPQVALAAISKFGVEQV